MEHSLSSQPSAPAAAGATDFLAGGGIMGAAVRLADWRRTPLGPVDGWPQSLRSALSICLGSSFQIAIYWGPELALIYNDAWSPILGNKHPGALGQPAAKVWPEIWDTIGPLFEVVTSTGRATRSQDQLLAMHRHGFTEECYFDYTFSPIRAEDGSVGGIFNAVVETTFRVIGERRMRTLRELSEQTANAASAQDACARAAQVLAQARHDLPFTLVYLSLTAPGGPSAPAPSPPLARYVLAGDAGQELPSQARMPWLDAENSPWPLPAPQRAGGSSGMRVVSDLGERFGNPVPGGPWPEPCTQAVVLPLTDVGSGRVLGVAVLGVSPRLALDEEYSGFMERVATAISGAVTRAQALEREREKAEELARLDRAKTAFFANVSHELRTPLTLILGPMSDLLSPTGDAPLSERQQAAVEMARRNAQRLLRLVNTLLDFSRIEAGRVEARFQPTDLPALTKDLAGVFRTAVERAGMTLDVVCEPLAGPAYVDRDMWEKIVLNLLSNAFKYTLAGGISLHLRQGDGQQAVLTVSDTGIGIEPAELPHLFERFHRVPNARGRTHEGTGIGLALVQELVNLHGGTIAVASTPGHGSRFTVKLPLGCAHLPKELLSDGDEADTSAEPQTLSFGEALVQEALRWAPPGAAPLASPVEALERGSQADASGAPPPAEREGRIVVADDSADMRDYLVNVLSSRFEVRTAEDGEAALALIRQSPPDLVLSDVMMPRLDGFGLLRALREDAALRELPVVLLSARAGETARIEGLDAHADDYLDKPFSARELFARVSAHVAAARVRAQAREALAQAEAVRRQVLERANRQLALQTERLRQLFEQAPGFMAVVRGPDHLIELVNAAGYQLLGRRPLVGLPVRQALPDIEGQGFFEILDQVRRYAQPFVASGARMVVRRAPDRIPQERYIDFVFQPFSEGDDACAGIFIQGFDVSGLKLAEQALIEADHRKDEFLATLAHELRNPLAPIRQAAAVARNPQASGAQLRWSLDVIERQVGNMALMLDDLLDVSRITRGRLTLRKEHISLRAVLDAAVETAWPAIDRQQHELEVQCATPDAVLHADPMRMCQIVANLLTNAAKYTERRGRILLTAGVQDGQTFIAVKDNGIGLASEHLLTVFDMFSQVQSAHERSQSGLGIGLALVKGLVELHGGTVSATSEGLGHGSTFTVRIPIDDTAPAPDDAAAAAHLSQQKESTVHKILLVDDNRDAAETLATFLELSGHTPKVVLDPQLVCDEVRAFEPGVVLMDIGLPGISGYDLARQLREQGVTATLVAVTGWGQDEDKRRAREAGFDHHLTKPVNLDALEAILRDA